MSLGCPCLVPTPQPQSWARDEQAGMLHPWLFLTLPTMFVLFLLFFQPWHTWDAQEGVVRVPVPDQQLLVWRNHLEREIKKGLLGGTMNIHPCTGPFRPTLAVPHFCETLLPPGTCQQSPTCTGRHGTAQDAALEVMAPPSTSTNPLQALPQAGTQTGLWANLHLQSTGTDLESPECRTQRSQQLRETRTGWKTETWRINHWWSHNQHGRDQSRELGHRAPAQGSSRAFCVWTDPSAPSSCRALAASPTHSCQG